MRTLRKNTQKLMYALQFKEIPEFEVTYYEDGDGNKYQTGAKPTGKTEILYTLPVEFLGNISMSGGEAEAVEYGLSQQDFEAVIVLAKGYVPLKEGALVWFQSEPQYKHIEMEVDGEEINGDFPIKVSADFVVKKVSPSLNFEKILLEAVNK